MKLEVFEMERMQSTYENVVKYNLSESGVHPVSLNNLSAMGLNIEKVLDSPFFYSQSNGTIELRQQLSKLYPGTSIENIEVTNGSSEANFIIAMKLLEGSDSTILQTPNYMQILGLARSFGGKVLEMPMRQKNNWEPDWEKFEEALVQKPKLMYLSNPNNPTGSVLKREWMERIVEGIDRAGVWLLADEVYQGAELSGEITPSFWGMSDRVIVVSGLSKAYGIPGVRIGWLVGPPDFIADCWSKHDYITIAPNTLSDMVARFAVTSDIRVQLFARTKEIIGDNVTILKQWVDSCSGFFEYQPPAAGAMSFLKYNHEIPSLDLVQRLHKNLDVLLVPGSHLGMEGYVRIALGNPREEFKEALALIKAEITKL